MLLAASNHRGWSFWRVVASFSVRRLLTSFCAPFALLPFTMFSAKLIDLSLLDFAFAFGCLYSEWKGTLTSSAGVASLSVPPLDIHHIRWFLSSCILLLAWFLDLDFVLLGYALVFGCLDFEL